MGMLGKCLVALSLVFATPALADTLKDPIPAEYQEGVSIAVVVFGSNRFMVENLCGDFTPDYITYSCYYGEELVGEGRDYIVSPNPCHYPEVKDPYSYAHVMCHEKAHKNGWRHKE